MRIALHKTVLNKIAGKQAIEAKRRERVKLANEHGMAMPLGNGTCLCCVDNSNAFRLIMIYDIITAVLIVTIPRALGAFKQRRAGTSEVTIYSKLRIANWMLILLLTMIGLCVYFGIIAMDDESDIGYQSNEDKVVEIIGLSAGTLLGLILDFHLCQVVAFKMSQLKFQQGQQSNPEHCLLNETE